MRVAIREQLAALVVFSVLVSLAIVSIPTWIFVQQFVVRVEQDGLALTASLKAARISSELELVQTTCQTIATRILIQAAYHSFYGGNLTQQLKDDATADLQSALSSGGFSSLLQARLWPRNDTGPETTTGLLNVTGINIPPIRLPYRSPNGSEVFLGDPNHGYPPSLYPNLTYQVQQGQPDPGHPWEPFIIARPFPDVGLRQNGGLLLGPLVINATYAIISLTVPVREINNTDYVLGYLTVVASATTLLDIRDSREGLGDTGMTLIIGPDNPSNRFNRSSPASNATYVPPDPEAFGRQNVHFILPPKPVEGQEMRHSERLFSTGDYRKGFPMADYPVVLQDFSTRINTINNASADLSTKNEQGTRVAVGYARPQTTLVNWTVVVEQNEKEAYATIVTLRNILLGCVFGTAGLVLLLVFPCAHLSVLPIRRLKAATEKSIAPPGYADGMDDCDDRGSPGNGCPPSPKDEKGFVGTLKKIARRGTGRAGALGSGGGKGPPSEAEADTRRRVFKIPARVEDRKHFITDELTELTTTFNEMSDELLRQYTSLEEKVAERTRELEISKKAAEAANESKTLFIANISHELKTPLNGIMGMCAVCMEEDDITRIKQSLKTLYKSGTCCSLGG